MPSLFIITGSNGAGKSSIGRAFLPDKFKNNYIFDGDKIFMEKRKELWVGGIRAIKEARNIAGEFVVDLFESKVDEAIASKSDFIYEGHFTNDSTWDPPRRFQQEGYKIHLIFLGLSNIDRSEARVIERAKYGGHYVDPFTIKSNFYGNMEKLDLYFEMFDSIQIVDTSELTPLPICLIEAGRVVESISKQKLPEWFCKNMPNIFRRFLK